MELLLDAIAAAASTYLAVMVAWNQATDWRRRRAIAADVAQPIRPAGAAMPRAERRRRRFRRR